VRALLSRETFVAELRAAIVGRMPYAIGKLGTSEKTWMYYEAVASAGLPPRQLHAYEVMMRFHALQQSGVFPPTPAFIREFNVMYVASVRALDAVGLFLDRPAFEDGVIAHFGLTNPLMHFLDQEPDRSVPSREDLCYLPALRGRKVLVICPFAELLKQRATEDIFEAVWAKTGKPWFYPAEVEALPLPYGFDRSTHERFGTVLDLYQHVVDELARRTFDVALIGAGGLGIPFAAAAKRLGKIGLSLGGHLQVLFGVRGQRWRGEEFQSRYVTDAWIDMPAEFRPASDLATVADGGSYW
jgi:hypothetical protein